MRDLASHYDRIADRYDARWFAYIRETTEATLAALRPRPGDRLLDVGCGTGTLLGRLGREPMRLELWGIDPSPGMLRRAREACDRCNLLAADAACLPFPAHTFDIVTSTSSLHCWREPRLAFLEAHRVLSPGGRLVVTDWATDVLLFKPFATYMRLTDPAVRHIHSSAELHDLLRTTGFSVRTSRTYRVSRFWGMMTVTADREPAPEKVPHLRHPPP